MKNLKEIISGLGGQYSPAYPSQMSVRFGVRENTARLFMHKVREAMK